MSLITDRLLLRPWTTDEAVAVRAGERRPGWAPDFPAEGDGVIAGLLAERPDWLSEFGHHLVVERATDLVVGSIGLFWPPEDGVVEIGYGIAPSRRGRGYATEATVALTEFALKSPDVREVSAQVERANPASVRVLEAAEFECVADDGDVLRFSSR
ncbi:GNAT family N-acetyltransferase [Amycolatopsis endophytica]|uniref:RimJ/RimL family protein N-acetyltransferase n=1 Tax=Amycolatopsis endophytica TaxID=860233 RepID=A0A853BEB5_9PSEU|nr:GNAT family N-acetyltransferase [Amycolatopsis endophytica]NYI93599.1 RimJ/RimL family protein N-acetyltransferase [Amycolatopsis endophytica]